MSVEIFKYLMTAIFVIITFYFSYIGMKKTKCLKSFAIGNGDMSPYIIGITMASSIASTATFVINPGFVYTHGLSALAHYAIAGGLGVITAFLLLTNGFRKHGVSSGALTLPSWIQGRYGHRSLSTFFAITNLLSITFVVLILVGCSIIFKSMFPISQNMALTLILLFVFAYVLMGGTYAHAYTNTFQSILMLGISICLFVGGLKYFDGGFFTSLESVSQNFAKFINPESSLYYDFFSVFLSSFIVTFALMLQPHIITKVLYIKSDKDVKKFLLSTFLTYICFNLVLFVGLYAQLSGVEVIRQDATMAQYLLFEYSSPIGKYFVSFVFLALFAAGLSTLDGILVALSSMVANDIFIPFKKNLTSEQSLSLSRYVLVAIGLISFAIAWSPPKLVGLFAQKGVYGLAAATFGPIVLGILSKKTYYSVTSMFVISVVPASIHFYLNIWGGVLNPSVSAAYGIICSIGLIVLFKAKVFLNNSTNLQEQKS